MTDDDFDTFLASMSKDINDATSRNTPVLVGAFSNLNDCLEVFAVSSDSRMGVRKPPRDKETFEATVGSFMLHLPADPFRTVFTDDQLERLFQHLQSSHDVKWLYYQLSVGLFLFGGDVTILFKRQA